ncbi:lipoprotein signal peptidase [Lampropedia puyangensis]|uniref:Lipoprotein signal peptidase n=1 Tax=Lampropedia puyangensis TaxID=1330072 RepID=A0A4S8F3V2_9BURK|nr:signal peptidase II [Lampropedia puyangensis]THT99891.1 lipoprotein signal peptidase [Lampropedia puyangensis]
MDSHPASPSAAVPAQQRAPFWRWLAIGAVVALLDQLIKYWIVNQYQWGDFTPVTSFFNLVRAHNTGAAFSFLANHDGWQRWFFIGIATLATVFIVWQLRLHGAQKLASLSLSLILGGAIGNVVDRVSRGYVVDYLDFHWAQVHFPAFNLADVAISCGVIGMILAELLRWMHERRIHAPPK